MAFSRGLNAGKYAALLEQARRLGRVRSEVWRRYASVAGSGLTDRQVRDQWMADGTYCRFGVLANAWKETLRDAIADIDACREAAKVPVRRAIAARAADELERRHLYGLLKANRWAESPFLSQQMRRHWRRGHNRTHNQIIIRADKVRTFTLTDGGLVWLAVPGLERRQVVRVPLSTTDAPSGTLRLILRGGRVEVHYQIDAATMSSSRRPPGTRTVGVDKGYSEVLTDSDGQHHGTELGTLLTAESDHRKVKNQRRNKLRIVAAKAIGRGNQTKADRIARHNLGTIKRDRRNARWRPRVRTVTFEAVHAVVDKAVRIVAEDLTKTFAGRKRPNRNTRRRLAAWTKGVTAEALANVSERRGSALVLVNAAYTSQVDPDTGALARRAGDRLHCASGAVWQADHAAAVNILDRDGDPDITLHTPHRRVRQIIQERTDRQRTRLPVQDSSPRTLSARERRANHPVGRS